MKNYDVRLMAIKTLNLGFGLAVLITATTLLYAQDLTSRPERGLVGKGTQSASDIDSINLQNGGVSLAMPLASLPPIAGGKLSYTLTASYNSKLWNGYSSEVMGTRETPGCKPTYSTKEIRPAESGSGWRIGGQYQIFFRDANEDYDYLGPESETCWGSEYYFMQGTFFKPMLRMPDGSEHEMRIDGYYPTYTVQGMRDHLKNYYKHNGTTLDPVFTSPVRFYTTDGTYLTVIYRPQTDPVKWTVYTKDGMRIEQSVDGQRTIDTNGNSILLGYNAAGNYSFAKDEQTSREIKWAAATYNGQNATKVEYQSVGGILQTVWVVWGTTSVQGKVYTRQSWNTQGGGGGGDTCFIHEFIPLNQFNVVREIMMPATEQGVSPQKFTFAYNSDTTVQTTDNEMRWACGYPMPSETYTRTASVGMGEISKITTPTGATIDYEYRYDGVHTIGALVGSSVDDVLRNVIQTKKITHDGNVDTWTYDIDPSILASDGSVTNPDGSVFSEGFHPVNMLQPNQSGDGKGGLQRGAKHSHRILIEKDWTLLGGSLVAFGSWNQLITYNPAVTTEYTTLLAEDGFTRLKISAKKFQYDYNGELLQTIEYDWFEPSSVTYINGMPAGVPAGATVLRVTNNSYYNQAADANSPNAYHKRSIGTLPAILGKPQEVTVGNGTIVKSKTQFSYDGQSYLTPPTLGNLTRVSNWDDSVAGGQWLDTLTTYTSRGNIQSATDAKGNVKQITYGSINGFTDLYPTQTVAAYGTPIARTSSAVYDFYTGLVTTATDVDNNVSAATEYDIIGRPTKVRSAPGTSLESWTRTEYSDSNRRIIVRSDIETIGDGKKVAVQHYDQLGRVRLARTLENILTEDPYNETHGIKVETRYQTGNPNSYQLTSNPFRAAYSTQATNDSTMGWTRSKSWNTGRKQEVETFSGVSLPAPWGSNTISTGKVLTDIDANATIITDQANKQRRNITNALGQLVRVDEPNLAAQLGSVATPNQPTYYNYNTLGKMVHVQQGVQNRYFMYDSLGRMLRIRQPEQEINTALNTSGNPDNNSWTAGFTYDNNGNVLTATEAKGTTITNIYDALNRVTSRSYNDGGITPNVSFYYDGNGVSPAPQHAKGKLTKVSSSVSESRYTQFDITGKLLQYQQITYAQTYTSAYQYNLSGALVEETYPSGRKVRNEFESDGELAKVDSMKGGTSIYRPYVSNFAYNAAGMVSQMKYGNGRWETSKFNSRLQLTEAGLGTSATNTGLWKTNFEYGELQTNGAVDVVKNSGNVAKQTLTVPGTSFVQAYQYDSVYRLAEAKETTGTTQNWIQNFGYDRYGNRTSFSQNIGGIIDNSTPAVDANMNRFNSGQGFSYDKNGNIVNDIDPASSLVRQFIFNGDNNQVEAKKNGVTIGLYFYDGEGRRVKKVTDTETTIFVYSAGKLIAEYSTQISQTPSTSYLTNDHLGSPRVITDEYGQVKSRRDFMPFGEELNVNVGARTASLQYGSGEDDVRQNFTGYLKDQETDLDFAEARMYQNRHGRFTAIDPLLASGKSSDPQSFNRYVYVMNDPIKFIDPNGLCSVPSGLKPGQVGICIEAFIAAKRLPGKSILGKGDNRSHSATENLSYKVRVDIIVTPQPKSGNHNITAEAQAGLSRVTIPIVPILGEANPDISRRGSVTNNTTTNGDTTNGTANFTLNISAENGFPNLPLAPSEPIDFSINFTVTPNNEVGLAPGGTRDGYPSIGIYSYEYVNGKLVTTVIYEDGEGHPDDLAPPLEKDIPEVKPKRELQ